MLAGFTFYKWQCWGTDVSPETTGPGPDSRMPPDSSSGQSDTGALTTLHRLPKHHQVSALPVQVHAVDNPSPVETGKATDVQLTKARQNGGLNGSQNTDGAKGTM